MLDCLCPDTAQMVVAQLTSKREFKGVTSLRASSLAWKREVDAFLEQMRRQSKEAAVAFRNAFVYLPLSLDNVLRQTRAFDHTLKQLGFEPAARVRMCTDAYECEDALEEFADVPTLMARARSAPPPPPLLLLQGPPALCACRGGNLDAAKAQLRVAGKKRKARPRSRSGRGRATAVAAAKARARVRARGVCAK